MNHMGKFQYIYYLKSCGKSKIYFKYESLRPVKIAVEYDSRIGSTEQEIIELSKLRGLMDAVRKK